MILEGFGSCWCHCINFVIFTVGSSWNLYNQKKYFFFVWKIWKYMNMMKNEQYFPKCKEKTLITDGIFFFWIFQKFLIHMDYSHTFLYKTAHCIFIFLTFYSKLIKNLIFFISKEWEFWIFGLPRSWVFFQCTVIKKSAVIGHLCSRERHQSGYVKLKRSSLSRWILKILRRVAPF